MERSWRFVTLLTRPITLPIGNKQISGFAMDPQGKQLAIGFGHVSEIYDLNFSEQTDGQPRANCRTGRQYSTQTAMYMTFLSFGKGPCYWRYWMANLKSLPWYPPDSVHSEPIRHQAKLKAITATTQQSVFFTAQQDRLIRPLGAGRPEQKNESGRRDFMDQRLHDVSFPRWEILCPDMHYRSWDSDRNSESVPSRRVKCK